VCAVVNIDVWSVGEGLLDHYVEVVVGVDSDWPRKHCGDCCQMGSGWREDFDETRMVRNINKPLRIQSDSFQIRIRNEASLSDRTPSRRKLSTRRGVGKEAHSSISFRRENPTIRIDVNRFRILGPESRGG
jgi:hypothetical protein